MNRLVQAAIFLSFLLMSAFAISVNAQIAEICGETGGTPWLNTPFVFGKVIMSGFDAGKKLPKVNVILFDRQQNPNRITIDRTGNYCFRGINGNGATLVIEMEGLEIVRRSLPSFGPAQHREDFEIFPTYSDRQTKPSAISAKFVYQRNKKNANLYLKADEAETARNSEKAVKNFKEIVATDPADFIVWAKLGSIFYEQGAFADAETTFRKSLEARTDYTPAMINLGQTLLVQKRVDEAIAILEKATLLEPNSPRAYQLLGEAYIVAKKGTLGVAALNEAIRLDPIGMAESHLLIARLYDIAGAKALASREYKAFLRKVPDHPDKIKLEQYIKENP